MFGTGVFRNISTDVTLFLPKLDQVHKHEIGENEIFFLMK